MLEIRVLGSVFTSLARARLVRALLALALVSGAAQVAQASSFDKTLSQGHARVTTSGSLPSACTVIVLGVGTAMSNGDYDNLASAITGYGYVFVAIDDNPGNITKTDATAFRNLLLAVKANLGSWLAPSCAGGFARWVVGGHSASGQAAQTAVAADPTLANAIFSTDPYNVSSVANVAVPALYWGQSDTTCLVDINSAAKAAYLHSTGHRVFQRVNVTFGWEVCGYVPHYYHCSYTNAGCPACIACPLTPANFYADVAQSVDKFVQALASGNWAKASLVLTNPHEAVTTFVDSDTP